MTNPTEVHPASQPTIPEELETIRKRAKKNKAREEKKLEALPEKWRSIIRKRIGLDTGDLVVKSLGQVAESEGVSRAFVLEIQQRAIRALQGEPVGNRAGRKQAAEPTTEQVLAALQAAGGNRAEAAKALNMRPRTLGVRLRRIRERGITIPTSQN